MLICITSLIAQNFKNTDSFTTFKLPIIKKDQEKIQWLKSQTLKDSG